MTQAQSVTATFATLSPAAQELDVEGLGGSGTITSSPPGIDCPPGSFCGSAFSYGTSVTLTATPAAGYVFVGWGGDCSGSGTCTVTMTQTRTVYASFEVPETLTVVKVGTGSGTVTSEAAGIDCGATCSHDFAYGTAVKLTAAPAPKNEFDGWSVHCQNLRSTSTSTTCWVNMTASQTVEAEFTAVVCQVPDVKLLGLAAAKAVLRQQHCIVGKVVRKLSKTVKKGMVISQSPAAGKHLAYGAPVNLVVSSGKPKAKHT
jgi:uncharacterized repeat protein (TIGR02543 family)